MWQPINRSDESIGIQHMDDMLLIDSSQAGENLVKVLQGWGYGVQRVTGWNTFIRTALPKIRPKVIMVRWSEGQLDLLTSLKNCFPGTPLILAVRAEDTPRAAALLDDTIVRYVLYPYHKNEILASIKAIYSKQWQISSFPSRFLRELDETEGIEELYGTIISWAREIFLADGAALFPYDAEQRCLDLDGVLTDGLGQDCLVYRREQPGPRSVPAMVLQQRLVTISDVEDPPEGIKIGKRARQQFHKAGIRAFIASVLTNRDQPVAFLYLNFSHIHSLSLHQEYTLRYFVELSSEAIRRVSLLEERDRRLRRLTHYQDLLKEIALELPTFPPDKNRFLENILQLAMRTTNARAGVIYLSQTDNHVLKLAQRVGIPRRLTPDMIVLDRARLMQAAQEALADGDSALHQQRLGELIRIFLPNCHSRLSCLITNAQSCPLGFIELEDFRIKVFDREHRRLIQALSHYIAIVLEYDRLYQSEQSRTAEMQRLFEAVKAMAALRPALQVLQTIVESLQHLFKFDVVTLHPYRFGERTFETPVVAGRLHFPRLVKNLSSNDQLLQRALTLKESYFTSDSLNDPMLSGNFTRRERIKASGCVPLRVGDETVGILFVNYRKPHHFSCAEEHAISLFAAQTSIAIYNARHFESLREQVAILEQAVWASQGVEGWKPLHTAIRELLEKALRKAKLDMLTLHLYDPNAQRFDRPWLMGDFRDYAMASALPTLESSILGRFIPDGVNEHYCSDAQQDELLKGAFVKREGVHTAAALRLVYRDPAAGLDEDQRVYGVLFANRRSERPFNEDEKTILRNVTGQLAELLHQNWLFRQSRERLELIVSTGKVVSQSIDLDKLLETLYEKLRGIFGQDIYPGVLLYNENNQMLEFKPSARFGRRIDIPEEMKREGLRLGEGLCGWVAENRQPLNVPDVTQEQRYLRLMQATRSEVAVPILLEDRLFGVLDIESSTPDKFKSDDVLLLQLIAKQVALALNNARIFQQSEEVKKQLLALMDSARLLSAPLDRKQNLQAILREACRLTGAHCAVYLVKRGQDLIVDQVYPPDKRMGVIRNIRNRFGQDMLPLNAFCIAAEAARSGKPKVAVNTCETTAVGDNGAVDRACSELAMPVLEGREVKGVLRLEHGEVGGLNQSHLDIMRALAGFLQNAERVLGLAEQRQRAEKHRILQLSSRLRLAALEEISSLVGDIDGRLDNLRLALQIGKKEQIELQLNKAQNQANKLCQVVNQLFSADQEEEIKLLPLAGLLEELLLSWRSLYPRVNIQLCLPVPNCDIQVRSSEIRLALDFLVKNAVDAVERLKNHAGLISIECRLVGQSCEIAICDNGSGIPANILKCLGKREISKGPNERGNGLGCLVVSLLAEGMNGKVHWENLPSGGAKATLSLPIAKLEE